MTKTPSDAEIIGTVVLTIVAVTFMGIGAIAAVTWLVGLWM